MTVNTDEIVATITVKQDITREFINDLMTTAFDGAYGGCWYWIADYAMSETTDGVKPEYFHDAIVHGSRMEIEVNDPWEDDVTTYPLTMDKVIEGIQKYAEMPHINIHDVMDDHDANDADCIVQLALWGEIIYG